MYLDTQDNIFLSEHPHLELYGSTYIYVIMSVWQTAVLLLRGGFGPSGPTSQIPIYFLPSPKVAYSSSHIPS